LKFLHIKRGNTFLERTGLKQSAIPLALIFIDVWKYLPGEDRIYYFVVILIALDYSGECAAFLLCFRGGFSSMHVIK
jgi:hypothetical protein